jgi:hypothetical protein
MGKIRQPAMMETVFGESENGLDADDGDGAMELANRQQNLRHRDWSIARRVRWAHKFQIGPQ